MKSMKLALAGFAIIAGTLTVNQQAFAKAEPSKDYFALGVGAAPKFVGTDNYKAIPIVFGHTQIFGMDTEILGGGVHLDVMTASSGWSAGPILNYQPKRDASDGNGRNKQLSDVKAAFEMGGFVARNFGGNARGEGALTMKLSGVHDVNNAYDGLKIRAEASYAAIRSSLFSLDFDISTTWGDADYQRTYLGVTAANALRSGLAQYRPSDGFRNVTVGVTLSHQFNADWGIVSNISVTRYVGVTADSPITQEGSDTIGLVGVSVLRRF